MSAREWLDTVEAGWPYNDGTHNEVALVAALRAVLDLMDECDATVLRESPHPGRRIVGVDPTTAQVRAAIDTHLGGAS